MSLVKDEDIIKDKRFIGDIWIETKAGYLFKWVRPNDSARGHRFCEVWVEEALRDTEFVRRVLPHLLINGKESINWF